MSTKNSSTLVTPRPKSAAIPRIRCDTELSAAIRQVSEAENLSIASLIIPILEDVFLPSKIIKIPIIGTIRMDDNGDNVVIFNTDRLPGQES